MRLPQSNITKILILFSALFFVSGTISSGASNVPNKPMSQEEALNWAIQLAPWYTKNYDYTIESMDTDGSENQGINIAFHDKADPYEDLSHLWINLNSRELVDYSVGSSQDLEAIPFPVKINRTNAKNIAQAFLYKAVPALQNVKFIEYHDGFDEDRDALLGPLKYKFTFIQENQTKRPFRLIDVWVNGDGKVVRFNSTGKTDISLQDQEKYFTPIDITKKLPDNIIHHKDKNALIALYRYNILPKYAPTPIDPNKSLKLGDMFQLLKLAIVPGSDVIQSEKGTGALYSDVGLQSAYYPSVFFFYKENWITPNKNTKLNVTSDLTRDTLAYYLTKIAGLEPLSEKYRKDPLITKLKDYKTIKHPGAVAIMMKTGWMNSIGTQFQPDGKVTLANLAVTLVKMSLAKGNFAGSLKK